MPRPKPYSLYGDPSPEKMEQIDKMFLELYQDLQDVSTAATSITISGLNYLTASGLTITTNFIDLTSHVTNRLPLANFALASAASRLLGRRSGSAGEYEEVSLGTGLSMSVAAVLSSDRAKPDATYLTATDESTDLPSSRRLIAGTNVTIDTSVANQATISATGGETHLDGYWSPLTDGDTVAPELIFDSNGDAIMTWVPTP